MKTSTRPFASALAAVLLAGVLGADAAAQAYKYKDEKGRVVFSDQPPPKGQAAEVIELEKSPAAPADNPDAVREEARKYLEEGSVERKASEDKRQRDQAEKAKSKQACEQARSRLKALTEVPPNRRLVQDADGTTRRVGAAEMSGLIDAARGAVARSCGQK